MSVNAISAGYQNQTKSPATKVGKEEKNHGAASQISKLNAEIKKAEAEVKKTFKEVQKATKENVGGASEKAQMLQSKMLLQQQAIMTKQMQIKEIESPKPSAKEDVSSAQPRLDRYIAQKEDVNAPDNVYRLGIKDGARQIIFNRSEE